MVFLVLKFEYDNNLQTNKLKNNFLVLKFEYDNNLQTNKLKNKRTK